MTLRKRLEDAVTRDPEILVSRAEVEKTLGSDPRWLLELGLDKQDLMKLAKKNFALKARYEIESKSKKVYFNYKVTGPHRVRWIIFKEALDEKSGI